MKEHPLQAVINKLVRVPMQHCRRGVEISKQMGDRLVPIQILTYNKKTKQIELIILADDESPERKDWMVNDSDSAVARIKVAQDRVYLGHQTALNRS